jgi:hypothetical protein
VLSTTTAPRCPELLRGLVGLGFFNRRRVPTPNVVHVIAPHDLTDAHGVQVVESYFDPAIRPRRRSDGDAAVPRTRLPRDRSAPADA